MITLYDSAIRLSELLSLRVSDVNLKKASPYLCIHGTGDKERVVSVSGNAVGHLERYIWLYYDPDSPVIEYLFYSVIHGHPQVMSPGNVARIINKYAVQYTSDLQRVLLPDKYPEVYQSGLPPVYW